MGERTEIGWTERSWNPWAGCTKISPGCKNCYMFTAQRRYGRDPAEVVRTHTWGDPLRWQRAARAAGRRDLVFTCSWSDWFHEAADGWREEAWGLVRRCPNLVFQILTKRADRIRACLPADWGAGYGNVWLGVSVEDQRRAEERVPVLLDTPAAVRFVSAEPLLGPVDLVPWLPGLDWVIVGGESGPGRRPCAVAWFEDLARQCREAGVACFVKQDGAARPGQQGRLPDDLWALKGFPRRREAAHG